MASSINPSNSHVLNTLVFNAGQLRRLFSDVTEIPVSSSVSSSFIKRLFVESEIYSTSVITSVPSVRCKYINISIQSTSSVDAPVVRIKSINTSITGDTESIVYEPYRDSYTDVTSVEALSDVESVDSYINSYVENSSTSTSDVSSAATVYSYRNAIIDETSTLTLDSIVRKSASVFIPGDTESIIYEPYRSSYTDVSAIEVSTNISSISSNINSCVKVSSSSSSTLAGVPSICINTGIDIESNSNTTVSSIIRKHAVAFIPGDTESVLYTIFRRSETDITNINTTSTLNIPFIVNKVFNTNINSNSIINNTSIPVRKPFNTRINNTSNLNNNILKSKLININITGDTEAFSYTVYRDVNTGITPVVTRSNVIVPTIIRHYYDVSNIDSTTSLTYSLSRNIVRYSDVESISSASVVIPTTIFTDISSIAANTDYSITTIRGKINSSNIINNTYTDSSAYRHRTLSSTIKEGSSVEYVAGRNKYTQSSFVDSSNVHLEQSGFLLYYNGRLKIFICPKSSPHHPEGLEYKVRGIETKERYPLNSFILGDILINDGRWTTSSYHFDTAETIKENTILDIHEVEEPVVVECDNKHSFFFTPATKSNRISLTPVVGKELKYNGHKIFE